LAFSEGSSFPWKSVWQTQAPSRAAFFTWSATLGKIITFDNLRWWHDIVMDICCMCKRNKELVDHLFIVMWLLLFGVFFFNCFGMSWVMCIRVIYLYDCWWSFDRPRSVAVRKMVPMCVLWCLWEEMNDRNFEDRERFMGYIICWLFLVIFFFILSFLVKLFLFYTSCVLKGASHFQ
jgi:hypothetical protein